MRDAMELYPGRLRNEVKELLWKELIKKLVPGAGAAVLLLIFSFSMNERPKEEGKLRPNPGEAAVSEKVHLVREEDCLEMVLPIYAREYKEEELEELAGKAIRYLEGVILGQNESFERITEPLYLPEHLPDELGGGRISWSSDDPGLVSFDGMIQNDELIGMEEVEITAELRFGSEKRYFKKNLIVIPKEYTEEEFFLRTVEKKLQEREQESRTADRFYLPETIMGYSVQWKEEGQVGAGDFLVLVAMLVPVLLYSNYFSSLDKRKKQRKEQAENCYMEFVTKLSLMLAAGVSVRQAYLRLAEEYENRYGMEHVLAGVLVVTKQELENGGSESEVYEAFGRRVGVLPYQRMASLLAQNVSKGVQGLRMLLLQEAKEVMAQERANIKVKGEQAGTKLLFPMMGLLFLVFAILLVPAFQSF